MSNGNNEVMKKFQVELKKGALSLAVLILLKEENWGYNLLKDLNEKGFDVSQDTLYPLLRRLEKQGLLNGGWRMEDESRPRRVFSLSEEGYKVSETLKAEWEKQNKIMEEIIYES